MKKTNNQEHHIPFNLGEVSALRLAELLRNPPQMTLEMQKAKELRDQLIAKEKNDAGQ